MSNTAQPNYKNLFAKKTAYLFLGRAMPVVILFIITVLYSRTLSYEDYGKFQSLWVYANVLNVVIGFGITSLLLSTELSAFVAFIKRHTIVISAGYILLLVSTLAIFLVSETSLTTVTKCLLSLFVIAQIAGYISETLLIKFHKEQKVLLVNFFYALLFFAWHYSIISLNYNLNHLIAGLIILSLAKFAVTLFFNRGITVATTTSINLDAKHWIYLGLNDVTGVFSRWIDKLLLIYLLTPADFAIFFNGSVEIPLFALLVSVAGNVMLVEMAKNVTTKENVIRLFTESFRILSLIAFPLFLFFLFFGPELFGVVFRHKYDASVAIFLISIFILPIRINNYGSILQYYQKGSKIMAGAVLDICLAVIFMTCLYPLLGTKGIALAIVLATYCQAIYYLWQSAKTLHTSILFLVPLKALVQTFAPLLLLYGCLYYSLRDISDGIKLIAASTATVVFILTGLLIYFSKKRVIV